MSWEKVCSIKDVLVNGGTCAKINDQHIAIFNYNDGQEWYAIDNVCPHENKSVLSRGIIGDEKGEPKVVCPLHKNAFSLKTGQHLGGNEEYNLKTYDVKVEDDHVFILMEN